MCYLTTHSTHFIYGYMARCLLVATCIKMSLAVCNKDLKQIRLLEF